MNAAALIAIGTVIGLMVTGFIVRNETGMAQVGSGEIPADEPRIDGAKNLAAFLMVIRKCEGTADEGGWTRLFGGGTFVIGNSHPNILVSKSGYKSTAAGAFQINKPTWDDAQRFLKLPDFSPASQTAVAVWLIQQEGAYDDVLAGNFYVAVSKVANRWASLPGSMYGQPTRSLQYVENVYLENGGVIV